jgi:hypothetical protein
MNPRVSAVKPGKNFTLELSFSNGEKGVFDMKPLLGTGLFTELNDQAIFNSVRIFLGSVQWQNGLDLCPDRLYVECVKSLSSEDIGYNQQMVAEGKMKYQKKQDMSDGDITASGDVERNT